MAKKSAVEDRLQIEVLPGIFTLIVLDPDHCENSSEELAIKWPGVCACPPDKGDQILSLCKKWVGIITGRMFILDAVFGPVLQLSVRLYSTEE